MTKNIKLFCIFSIFVVVLTIIVFTLLNRDDLLEKDNSVILTEEEISLVIIEPDFINPLVSKNKYVQEVANLVFDGLVELNDSLKPELSLAKIFIPDETLLNWNITLRDDVYFHNGIRLTVDDIIFTVNKIKELGNDSYFYYNVKNIKEMEKKSDYEMTFVLDKADNFFISKMDIPVLSKSYYINKSITSDDKYVGTGPYEQVDFNDNKIILKAFPKYYKEVVGNIKNIDVKIIENARPGFELLKLNEIDIADTNTEVGAYGRSAYNNKRYVSSVFEGIIFNPDNEVLNNEVLRQAILLGVNRDLIVENFVNGYGISVDLPINPNSYLVNRNLVKYSYNPEKAQDILNNNDFKVNETLGIRTNGNDKLSFKFLVNKDNKNSLEKAEFIKDNLKKIGIEINIVLKNSDSYSLAISNKEYDLALTSWAISEYPEFLYNFETNSENNIFGFSDKDYDYYVFMAKAEYLEGKSREYFEKMQEILAQKLPLLGLYFETSTVYYNKKIEDKLTPTINNIYKGIENIILTDSKG